jgi:hypothetical protein
VVFAELKVNLQNVAGIDIVSETDEQVKWFFARINTEHKLYKELEKRGFYRGFYIVPPNSQGEDRFKNHPVCPNYAMLCYVQTTFQRIYDHVQFLAKGTFVINFMQTEFWKNKIKNITADIVSDLVLPLFVYFDDFGTGNSLGPNCRNHSIASTYLKLPFLPIEIESKLDNIITACLMKSKDKILGNRVIFQPLISELQSLEKNGIDIIIEGKKIST